MSHPWNRHVLNTFRRLLEKHGLYDEYFLDLDTKFRRDLGSEVVVMTVREPGTERELRAVSTRCGVIDMLQALRNDLPPEHPVASWAAEALAMYQMGLKP